MANRLSNPKDWKNYVLRNDNFEIIEKLFSAVNDPDALNETLELRELANKCWDLQKKYEGNDKFLAQYDAAQSKLHHHFFSFIETWKLGVSQEEIDYKIQIKSLESELNQINSENYDLRNQLDSVTENNNELNLVIDNHKIFFSQLRQELNLIFDQVLLGESMEELIEEIREITGENRSLKNNLCQEWIGNLSLGKIKEVLISIQSFCKKKDLTAFELEISHLSSRWYLNENEVLKGIKDSEKAGNEVRKITYGIANIIKAIEKI